MSKMFKSRSLINKSGGDEIRFVFELKQMYDRLEASSTEFTARIGGNVDEVAPLLDKVADVNELVTLLDKVDDKGPVVTLLNEVNDVDAAITLLNKADDVGPVVTLLDKVDDRGAVVTLLNEVDDVNKAISLLNKAQIVVGPSMVNRLVTKGPDVVSAIGELSDDFVNVLFTGTPDEFMPLIRRDLDFGFGEKPPAFWSGGLELAGEAARDEGKAIMEDTLGGRIVYLLSGRICIFSTVKM